MHQGIGLRAVINLVHRQTAPRRILLTDAGLALAPERPQFDRDVVSSSAVQVNRQA